ncbi:pentapeptide repeat-containing protein [Actinokineospora bangkokensis]|uniref:pentapeptide repeat-containing protein n=1 Tax=Actinokineospora bangkokensis TaxID=1193682 RepID=UPI0013016FCC|nr:pentapeptide repeat-containing protein [Actinokineospora bangkokensis]
MAGLLVGMWLLVDPGTPDAGTQLELVRIGLTVLLGSGGLFGLWLAWRRQRSTEIALVQKQRDQADVARAYDLQREDSLAKRITELYTKAAEQLGSDKAPVRLAGLYALERLAQDHPEQRQTVVNVLCAYLRMPYTLPGEPPPDDADNDLTARHRERVQEREVRLTAQRILTHHLRPGDDPDTPATTFWADIDLDLTGATLIDLDLASTTIRTARFRGTQFHDLARFTGAQFHDLAWFDGAQFHDAASFDRAQFHDVARFDGAHFDAAASFDGAQFHDNARFGEAHFDAAASFDGAQFHDAARFDRARFHNAARFDEAQFRGSAQFDRAQFRGAARFDEAQFSNAAWFNGAQFSDAAWFNGAQFRTAARFTGAQFGNAAWFDGAQFGNAAWFDGAQFRGAARFDGAQFHGAARFDRAQFNGGIPEEVKPYLQSP